MQQDTQHIDQGWSVFDARNEKVGDVAEAGTGWVLVQKGLIFIKDVYIPTSSISRVDATNRAAYLDLTKDQVDGMGWDLPPADTGTYDSSSLGATSTGTADLRDDDAARVRLHEEELQASTRREQTGSVDVRKKVVASEQQVDVDLEHDELDIRRVKVDREATPGEAAFTDDGETIRVPMTAETVEVTKTPRVVEEIEISKRPVKERQAVRDTVRREEVEVQREGDVRLVDDDANVDSGLVGSGADRVQRTDVLDEDVQPGTPDRGW
jgi:uncharacterized protein (TIGR02271 family)